jgi:hypothetical protein
MCRTLHRALAFSPGQIGKMEIWLVNLDAIYWQILSVRHNQFSINDGAGRNVEGSMR